MQKKLVAIAVVSGLGFLAHRKFKKLQTANIVFQMKPEEINLPPKVFQELSKVAMRILPYAGFCEITGCTHEVHSNNPEGFQKAMSDHLSKEH